jgi:DNA (cytosine-5)-methyltransferase 3A
MKVLSLFDGISCARVALERAGIPVEAYYASEIDKYAIQVSNKNYPDIVHIGDVKSILYDYRNGVFYSDIINNDPAWTSVLVRPNTGIDLLIGGSPCQDLSIAKRDRKGLDGERSGLFWEYVRILEEVKPKYFILENVASMPKEAKDLISETLGVQPIMINAALVSAQQRKRLFWTNIPNVTLPKDKGILLKDILIDGIETKEKSLCVTATYSRACPRDYFEKSSRQLIKVGEFNKGGQGDRVYSIEGKSVTLSALGGGRGAKTGLYETTHGTYRKLHPIETERLQGLPDNYTEGISNSQRYKCCGNAFNVDVVAHILSFIKLPL